MLYKITEEENYMHDVNDWKRKVNEIMNV